MLWVVVPKALNDIKALKDLPPKKKSPKSKTATERRDCRHDALCVCGLPGLFTARSEPDI